MEWRTLNSLMDVILYRMFRNILNTLSRSMKYLLINHQSNYVSTKLKTKLHLRLKLSFTLNTRNYETTWKYWKKNMVRMVRKNGEPKTKNGENVLQLEITEVVLVHCNTVNNKYQHDLLCTFFFQVSHSVCY